MSKVGKITFDASARDWVLKTLGLHVGPKGFLYDTRGNLAASLGRGEPVKKRDFAGAVMAPQGLRLVTKDIFGIIDLADHYQKKEAKEK